MLTLNAEMQCKSQSKSDNGIIEVISNISMVIAFYRLLVFGGTVSLEWSVVCNDASECLGAVPLCLYAYRIQFSRYNLRFSLRRHLAPATLMVAIRLNSFINSEQTLEKLSILRQKMINSK